MPENLASFLADVGTNPDLLAAFTANPERYLQDAHLTDEERAAVLTRNSRRIAAALNVQGDGDITVSNQVPLSEPTPTKEVPKKKKKAPARRKKTPTTRKKKAPKTSKKRAPRKGGRKTPSRSRKTPRSRR